MLAKELLKEKTDCYATDKVYKCNEKCRFYWTCLSYRQSLRIGDIKDREVILNHQCH